VDPVLIGGLGAIFLSLCIGVATLATVGAGRGGVNRALSDIEHVYAPSGPMSTGGGRRAYNPAAQTFTALGRALTPKPVVAWTVKWLNYAGNPPSWPPDRVLEVQGLGFFVLGVLGGLLGLGMSLLFGTSLVLSVIGLAVVGAAVGWGVPLAFVLDGGQRRQDEVRRLLPDALDMLTLSVEAGLPFDAALHHVVSGTRGPLAREIARALNEMQMGKERAEAMRALADRTSIRELRTVAVAVVQATELGVPLAGVLREQATEMRIRRRQYAEEKARKVPVKILFPLVFCLFPALFLIVLGPGILNLMDAFG
jgi:tight adherence protein C